MFYKLIINSSLKNIKQGCIGFLPKHINSKDEIFDAIAQTLNFPDYFGRNWNALSDCLRDLHWIKEKEIYLVHTDIPDLPIDDKYIYFDILRYCCFNWKEGEEHQLFMDEYKQEVIRISNYKMS